MKNLAFVDQTVVDIIRIHFFIDFFFIGSVYVGLLFFFGATYASSRTAIKIEEYSTYNPAGSATNPSYYRVLIIF